MKLIRTEDAAGHVLCHDITRILVGKEKGPVFKKGHVVTKEDIPVLLSVGKEHLYVWEKDDSMLHEDEAAEILRRICMGEEGSLVAGPPSEGKIEIRAAISGLFVLDRQGLLAVNSQGQMMIAAIHSNTYVKAGQKLAGTRVIPLVIEKEKMARAREAAGPLPLMRVLPLARPKTAVVTTGSEVAGGRIPDAFGPVLQKKLAEYDVPFMSQTIVGDGKEEISQAILSACEKGADLVLVSGGMSVDPDDNTPGAIKATGAEVVTYGAPVLPGAMMMLAYLDYQGRTMPILGLPGCVMYAKRTIFDLVFPRVLAGQKLTGRDISAYGEGGLCLNCEVCHFPNCGFGKS